MHSPLLFRFPFSHIVLLIFFQYLRYIYHKSLVFYTFTQTRCDIYNPILYVLKLLLFFMDKSPYVYLKAVGKPFLF